MDRHEALQKLHSSTEAEMVTALASLGNNGSVHDLSVILSLQTSSAHDIRQIATGVAASIIRTNLLDNYNILPEESRTKLSIILNKLAPEILMELIRDIQSDHEKYRINAIRILKHLKGTTAVKNLLISLLEDSDQKVRATAVQVLSFIATSKDYELFFLLLSDKDHRVRANTVEAIEALNNSKLYFLLYRLKNDPNNRIRANTLKALFNMGYKKVPQELELMLQMKDEYMQASALWVLSQVDINSTTLVHRCGALLKSSSEMVVANAEKALLNNKTPLAKEYLQKNKSKLSNAKTG